MLEITLVAIAALLVGFVKGGFGPLGALIVPLLTIVMPTSQAVGLVLPMLLVGDAFAVRAYWREWDMRYLRLTLPSALVGIALALLLLNTLSDDALRRLLGIFTLSVAAYKLASDRLKQVTYTPRDWHGSLAGSMSGFASALANAGGPPMTAYLLLQKLAPVTFVGTSTLFFVILNVIKLPPFLIFGVLKVSKLLSVIYVLPLIPVGVWLGRQLINRINWGLFDALMTLGLISAGVLLLAG